MEKRTSSLNLRPLIVTSKPSAAGAPARRGSPPHPDAVVVVRHDAVAVTL